MNKLCFDIEGVNEFQINEMIENFNSIEYFKAYQYTPKIEVKERLVLFVLEITQEVSIGIISGLITYYILKFFEKEKSNDDKPITINIKNIQINQEENIQEIENKVNIILKNSR